MEPVRVSPSTAGLSQGLPEGAAGLSESVSAGLLPEVLSSAGAAGLSEDLSESLSPPVLLRSIAPPRSAPVTGAGDEDASQLGATRLSAVTATRSARPLTIAERRA